MRLHRSRAILLSMIGSILLLAAILCGASMLCAAILRLAGCSGWPVIGGIVAGIVLGPTIMGRIPALADIHESLFVGGMEQRQLLDETTRQQVAAMLASEHAGTNLDDQRDAAEQHLIERQRLEAALLDARRRDQFPMRVLCAIAVVFVLLGAGGSQRASQSGAGWIAPLSIGTWSAALPGAAAYFCCRAWFGFDETASLLASAAVMIGPWRLRTADRNEADRAEIGGARTVEAAGRFASVIAIATVSWAVWRNAGVEGFLIASPLMALLPGWILPFMLSRMLRTAAVWLFIPMLAALTTVKIELLIHFSLWPILAFAILSGDGRWFGAVVGAMLPGGRRLLRTMRLVLGSMACGPTQLTVAAIALHHGLIQAELAYGLLCGAALIEVTAPLRRRAATEIIELEDEIDEMNRESQP
ncbi:MAG TPA: hypothetical protein PK098_02580 [Phycisphaerales bacterium]|nr:hypothetical protein [Phycisphaerales bacterium]